LGRHGHDPQAQVGRVPAVLAEGGPQDGQAAQPGHVRHARRGREARARRAVFQAQRVRHRMPEQQTSTLIVPPLPRPPRGRGDTPDVAERGPNPDAPAEVAAGLLGYLRRRWEAPDLAYTEEPAPLG